MEASGKVTFLLKSEEEPVTKNDMNIKAGNSGLLANLIMDGNIMDNNLKAFGKDRKWLIKKVKESGYDVENIFLLVSDSFGNVSIYEKDYRVNDGILE